MKAKKLGISGPTANEENKKEIKSRRTSKEETKQDLQQSILKVNLLLNPVPKRNSAMTAKLSEDNILPLKRVQRVSDQLDKRNSGQSKKSGDKKAKEIVASPVDTSPPAKKGQRGKKFCPSCEQLMPIHC